MTYVYSPEADTESILCEEKGLSCIKQRLLFTGGLATPHQATPFSNRSALLSSTKQPVLVYLRVRPKNSVELATKESTCLSIDSDNVLLAIPPKSSHTFKSNNKTERTKKNFFFSQIFPPETTQKTVFRDAVLPTIEDFLNGQNSLVFSYGVTNSGKSYTVTGKSAEPGILPRALDVIFNSIGDHQFHGWDLMPRYYADAYYLSEKEKITEIENKKALLNKAAQLQQPHAFVQPQADTSETPDEGCSTTQLDETSGKNTSTSTTTSNISRMTEEGGSLCLDDLLTHEDTVLDVDMLEGSLFTIWVSFAEIYNEFIYDLLGDEPKPGKQRNALKISEDRSHNPFIKGLREVKVESVDEALQLLRVGMQHRHVAATRLNYHSSRSHAIFTIKILRVNHTSRRPKVARINRLSIVDLAGSESTKRTGATGVRVREAGNINNSLLTLGRCIEAMRHNQSSRRADEHVVPFRESKLTQLLQTYFVGKGKGAREGKVTMFVNVSDTASVFDETVRVLNFSALASKIVPETRLLPPSLLPIPESSPFKLDTEEKEIVQPHPKTTSSYGEDIKEETCEVISTTSTSCSKCKVIEKEFESFKERARDELARAKLEVWEKEYLIRQQVSNEYNEQIVEIEDKHSRELYEQEEMLEEMYQERLGLLHKSMKKQQSRKRVRMAADDDEEGDVHEEAQHQAKEAMRKNDQLIRHLDEARLELELEQKRAASELRDLSITHETNVTKLREITNTLSLEVDSLKKDLAKASEDKESLQNRLETFTTEQTVAKLEREQALKQAESFRQKMNASEQEKENRLKAAEKENEELLMQIIELESSIRSPSGPLDEASSQTDPAITGWGVVQELMAGSMDKVTAEAAQVELETLRGLVDSLRNEISSHRGDEILLKSQLETLRKELKTSEALICEQETTLSHTKQQLEERSREENLYCDKIQQLTSDLKNATSNASVSEGLVLDLKNTLQQYETTFQSHSSRVTILTNENEVLKESNEALQEKAEANSEEIASLRVRVERMSDSKDALSARIEELTDELAKSSRHLMQRETELTEVHESAREVLENQLADHKKRCAMLEQEIKQVYGKLEEKEEVIVGLHKSSSSEQVTAAVKVTSLNEELQQVREALRAIEEERDQLKETMAENNQQLDSMQGNHQLELAQMSIKLRTLSEQLISGQQSAEAKLCEMEQFKDQCENKLRKENQHLQEMLDKKTAEMTSNQKKADTKLDKTAQQVAELKQESQRLTQLLKEEKSKVTDLEQKVAHLQSPETEVDQVYEEPPEMEEPLYDSVQDDDPLPAHESTCTDQNTTRQLPLLEHSSQLRDSFEDFEIPSPRKERKVVKYDPLKDAIRPKKKKVMATVNKSNETPSGSRYALRSRTKQKVYTELTTDSDTENTTPIQRFKRLIKGKKTVTTEKKKKITKSSISSPIVLGQATPEVTSKKRQAAKGSTKMTLGNSLLPPSRAY